MARTVEFDGGAVCCTKNLSVPRSSPICRHRTSKASSLTTGPVASDWPISVRKSWKLE